MDFKLNLMPFGEDAKIYENLGISKGRLQELLNALNNHDVEDLKQSTKLMKYMIENHCQVLEEVAFVCNLIGSTIAQLRCPTLRVTMLSRGIFKSEN